MSPGSALADVLRPGRAGEGAREREAHAAVLIAAGLYLVGALLCASALLLPEVASPVGVLATALAALATAVLLSFAATHAWGGLPLAFLADVWGLVLIAVLCASAGGADSPYALIYFFAIGHAAAFQPRRRLLLVCGAGLLAYLSPLLYDGGAPAAFGAVAAVGIVLALLAAAVMHFALNRLRTQREQLETLISTLRRSLMPAVLPVIPGLALASYFRPLGSGEEVGGDFYDAFGDRGGCWLIVGDVCGKGAEAAALTGFLRHTAAAYAREESSPARVLEQVNRAMLDQDFDGRFATAVLVRLSFEDGLVRMTVALAGHPAPLLARADGGVEELGGSGALLGIFADPAIEETVGVLRPGDSLALYTDGLAEAHAPRSIVSVEQMLQCLRLAPISRPQAAIDALLSLIDLDGRLGDDIAILAARVEQPDATPGVGRERPAALAGRT